MSCAYCVLTVLNHSPLHKPQVSAVSTLFLASCPSVELPETSPLLTSCPGLNFTLHFSKPPASMEIWLDSMIWKIFSNCGHSVILGGGGGETPKSTRRGEWLSSRAAAPNLLEQKVLGQASRENRVCLPVLCRIVSQCPACRRHVKLQALCDLSS